MLNSILLTGNWFLTNINRITIPIYSAAIIISDVHAVSWHTHKYLVDKNHKTNILEMHIIPIDIGIAKYETFLNIFSIILCTSYLTI